MLRSSQVAESGVKVSSRILRRYLLQGEQVKVATRQHWGSLAEPVVTVAAGFFVLAWLTTVLVDAFGAAGLNLWWIWLALVVRLVWKVLEWRENWFCATNKRLLKTDGLVTHKVAMMPLGKITDLSYGRSVVGRAVGYGAFTLESAGQDQALRFINWIPDPDETYRLICAIVFGEERFDREDSLDSDDPSRQVPVPPQADATTVYPRTRPQRPSPRRLHIPKKDTAGGESDTFDASDIQW
ncbi:MAG: PH domain-containing protein [Ilumatobacter sp.]|uniref:PH domain-containing protein n=1 Tax=Ilumatobacter sp. TaxID=1967498 RepID=UPI003C713D51